MTELIPVSIISGIFSLVGITMFHYFWTKKYKMKWDFERFKLKEYSRRAREKSIISGPGNPAPNITPVGAGDWISKLAGLDREKLGSLLDLLPTNEIDGGAEPSGSIEDKILDFATQNPEMAQQFISQLAGGKTGGKNQEAPYL